ncbi:SOS response-associated peptidase [Spongisporangium articulatum]|uniref:Abasic site processing protein n=1 Tax=Spongisporangium articulatum TaxID=3362603 RepID=A0ABW8APR6_9ACTN
MTMDAGWGRLARMCGRYASSRTPEDLVEMFDVEEVELPDVAPQANFNVAPTSTSPIVLERQKQGEDDDPPVVTRQLRWLTWGLVPSWAKDATGGARMINARAESLLEKPAFKRAATARRCLVPADGWYEWQASPTEKVNGKPRKQPFFMRLSGGEELAFAGIYEFWRDQEKHADDETAWLVTYSIVTTAAEPGLDTIHDRMPFVVPSDRWAAWLDPAERDPDTVRALLEPPEPGRFEALPVTTRVNSVRNNGPELLEPAPLDTLAGVVDPSTGELIGSDTVPLF